MVARIATGLLGLVLLVAVARPAEAAVAANGKLLFQQNCASCHGVGGKGDGPTGVALAAQGTPPRDFTKGEFKFDTDKDGKAGSDVDLTNVLKNGAGAYGGSPLMAPWSHLGDAGIADLVAHIKVLSESRPAPAP
jgi:mono/diheme cytochrome c family protein